MGELLAFAVLLRWLHVVAEVQLRALAERTGATNEKEQCSASAAAEHKRRRPQLLKTMAELQGELAVAMGSIQKMKHLNEGVATAPLRVK